MFIYYSLRKQLEAEMMALKLKDELQKMKDTHQMEVTRLKRINNNLRRENSRVLQELNKHNKYNEQNLSVSKEFKIGDFLTICVFYDHVFDYFK